MVNDIRDFYKICDRIKTVSSAMRLRGKVEGKPHEAHLLIYSRHIIAASLENLEDGGITVKGDALMKIRDMMTVGKLDIHLLDFDDLRAILLKNKETVLKSAIPLHVFAMKIKLITAKDEVPKQDGIS